MCLGAIALNPHCTGRLVVSRFHFNLPKVATRNWPITGTSSCREDIQMLYLGIEFHSGPTTELDSVDFSVDFPWILWMSRIGLI
jgi:hypothetical protein